jgi:serine/threonine protein kinase
MSPEMVKHQGHDASTDLWSAGAILYNFTYDQYPYGPTSSTADKMKAAIAKGEPPQYSSENKVYEPSSDAVSFIQKLLDRNASTRVSAADALKHAFIISNLLEIQDVDEYYITTSSNPTKNCSKEDLSTVSTSGSSHGLREKMHVHI